MSDSFRRSGKQIVPKTSRWNVYSSRKNNWTSWMEQYNFNLCDYTGVATSGVSQQMMGEP